MPPQLSKNYRDVNLTLMALGFCAWLVVLLGALSVNGLLPGWLDAFTGLLTHCPYKQATGLACMLCGSTTAAITLLGGDLPGSLVLNPIAAALVPTGIIQLPYRFLRCINPILRWAEEAVIAGICLAAGAALVLLG